MNTDRTFPAVRYGAIVAALFFLVATALTGVLPLWLDEIIQLRETRGTSPAQLMASLPGQPGAAPLGYLLQQTTMRATGYSVRSARIPSALFMAGSVFVVAMLGAELGLARAWAGAAIFGLFPLTLRYAAEARIYSQALFFATLATLLFMRLVKQPGWLRAALYCVAMVAAIYTQPFAIFVGVTHVLFAALYRDRKGAVLSGIGVVVAVAAFLPWYLRTKASWSSGISGVGIHFVFSAKTPLMLFREVVGAGYWGSGLLLILCVLAVAGRKRDARVMSLLGLLICVPIVLALAADGWSGYFVATRQIIWVLPAVALFAALAIERKPRIAVPLAGLLAVLCVWQSVRFFTAPKEDWQLAANVLSGEVQRGACLMVVPPEQEYPYEFFQPELAKVRCPALKTVVAFTPYATDAQRAAAVSSLRAAGYTQRFGTGAGKSKISLYTR